MIKTMLIVSLKLVSDTINSVLRNQKNQHGFTTHKSGSTNLTALCNEMTDYTDKVRTVNVI